MEIHLKIVGYLLIALALLHVIFPTYFKWKTALASLTLLDRQLMYVHTFFVALVVLLMGLLCVSASEEITHSILGKKIALGLFVFWALRLYFQFFVYSPELWRGKRFETFVHVLFSAFWFYISAVFLIVYLA